MQTMSTDPQSFYPNSGTAPHQPTTNYYLPNNAMDSQFQMPVRNPTPYVGQRMGQGYINQQMSNGYPPYYPQPTYLPAPPFVSAGNPRMNTSYIQIIRPPNENLTNQQNYMPQGAYSYGPASPNIPSTTPVYPQQFFQHNFQMQPNYPPLQTQQIPTQQIQQPQYTLPTNAQQPTQIYQTQPTQHQQIEQSNVPTSQPSIPQNIQQTNVYATAPPTGQSEKRARKPIPIVDPVSHKALEISTPNSSSSTSTTNPSSSSTTTTATTEIRPTETTTDSTTINTKPANDTNKTQIQTNFRHQIAKLLTDSSTDKNTNQSSASTGSNDDPPGAAPTKQHPHKQIEPVVQQSTSSASSSRSGSISRPKSPSSEQPQPAYPGIRTRTLTDDKLNSKPTQDDKRERSDSQKQQEPEPIDDSKSTSDDMTVTKSDEEILPNPPEVQPTPPLSAAPSLECVTPPQTPTPVTNSEKTEVVAAAAPNQRLRYDRHELLRIRDISSTLPIPHLPDLDIVLNNNNNNNRRDQPRFSYPYTGTNSQGRVNPPFHRQLSSSNHPSLTRHQNNQPNSSSDSRRNKGIYLSNEPDFSNRVENPYKPVDQAKIYVNNKVLRDCKAILNKVTPQTFEKLQKQLEIVQPA
jgi:hypothetical protein